MCESLRYLWIPLLAFSLSLHAHEVTAPQPCAHAHNDYAHTRPLLDALEQGFCSVEADIFLVDGQLLVAHDRRDARPERTLRALYLAPLRARAQQNAGRVYRDGPQFWLLIDIKSDGAATYQVLRRELEQYRDILTTFRADRVESKAVTVIISGNRPRDLMAAEPIRYAAVDGRLSDLESGDSKTLVPWISDNWTQHFQWRGAGPLPEDERRKLVDIVSKAHAQGRLVRFWATPDMPSVWKELVSAEVDFINTDDLAGLREFLSTYRPNAPYYVRPCGFFGRPRGRRVLSRPNSFAACWTQSSLP